MNRRSFLRSIVAAVALAPVLARLKFEQPEFVEDSSVTYTKQIIGFDPAISGMDYTVYQVTHGTEYKLLKVVKGGVTTFEAPMA